MRFKKRLSILLTLSMSLIFNSCNLSYDKCNNGEEVLNFLIKSMDKDDKKSFADLFSVKTTRIINLEPSINKAFEFCKGKIQKIDYNYTVESGIWEDSDHYKFDECLAFIETTEDIYSFEFLLCKNNDFSGIITLVISTEQNRKSSEYSDFIDKAFDNAKYFDNEYLGIFIK